MKLLNVREAANLLSLSVPTVRRLTLQGEIPVTRLGRSVRYRETDLLEYVEKHTATVQPAGGDDHAA